MTKKQAIEILIGVTTEQRDNPWRSEGAALLTALDRAGAFVSEETAARIAKKALSIEADAEADNGELSAEIWRASAIQLVKACRAAGLVKP